MIWIETLITIAMIGFVRIKAIDGIKLNEERLRNEVDNRGY